MKKTALFSIAATMFCCFCVNVAFSEQEKGKVVEDKSMELKTRVVRIQGYEGVSPLNLFIKPGTVVIWINQYHGDVEIKFPNKKVTIACKSPVNFSVNKDGVFESTPIGYGAVASMCFVERGTFDYLMERSTTGRRGARTDHFRFEGKIVVK